MRFETQVGASVVGRSSREYAAQSDLRESRESGEAVISEPLQVIRVRKMGLKSSQLIKVRLLRQVLYRFQGAKQFSAVLFQFC
jgi:hypothetical protein